MRPTTKKPRRRRRNTSSVVAPTSNVKRSATKMRGSRTPGVIHIKRTEMLKEVQATASRSDTFDTIPLSTDQFAYLKTLANNFENVQWNSIRIFWVPAVGTNSNGMITYGCDYKFTKAKTTRSDITSFTPSASHPIWCDTTNKPLTVPKVNLMTRKFYSTGTPTSNDQRDYAPLSLSYGANHDNKSAVWSLGEFWISYSLTLSGTSA